MQDREEVGERGHQWRCSPGLRLAKSVSVVATTVTGASGTTTAADGEAEARMAAVNEGFPGRFLGPRRRGKRGASFAPLRFARRALKRWRCGGGIQLRCGHGGRRQRERERGREQVGERVGEARISWRSLSSKGTAATRGSRAWRQCDTVPPLLPQGR